MLITASMYDLRPYMSAKSASSGRIDPYNNDNLCNCVILQHNLSSLNIGIIILA